MNQETRHGSNPVLIRGFFEHGRRGRVAIFWIFLIGMLTAFLPLPPAWHQFIRLASKARPKGFLLIMKKVS
jgi:hypothetical protein